jgi:hypothetical protein
MAIKNVSIDSCFLCKVEIFSCDTFLVCSTILQKTDTADMRDTAKGHCRFIWGAPALAIRDTLGNILNCNHNLNDCNTYPMTLVPFSGNGATTNDPYCADSAYQAPCRVGPGKQLEFRICLKPDILKPYKRLTFRLWYSCPLGGPMKSCKRIFMWKDQEDINKLP